ncbi:dipeptide ABC transporter ATP-binding protein [Segnochrobactrum spirostomi]|uniref:ABC transporter ATP-binding protein n=1 Tax=Segnochrobactrum spirostomi TaxID=2608987 RepID=A0A6A7YDI4_9HYPH|nr:ABC transporter ATP-binding protein [Segnochrobactrum spirostomi]MQT15489.1 ABC transporter ATP-binding protein [Segnochrobactrum spirostomi]
MSATIAASAGPTPATRTPLLSIEALNVWFALGNAVGSPEAHVVRDVSLHLEAGECYGLIGESGSGKTTTIQAVMGLLPSSARVGGRIVLNGENILARGEASVAPHRWKDVAMVFQGAMNALNPVKTVGWQIAEAMEVHGMARGRAGLQRVGDLLGLVGIAPDQAARYPHQFSGGMRQRAIIAMALACNPKVLLADEPTTALDVMIQKQVLELLVRLGRELQLGVILVTHDLGVVAETCARAGVMLKGELVEQGAVTQLYHHPAHPYTGRLFKAAPTLAAAIAGSPVALKGDDAPLLRLEGLRVAYATAPRFADIVLRRRPPEKQAVDGISLSVRRGDLVALVGQSGCGKTSTLQATLGMVPANGGHILFEGRDLTGLPPAEWRRVRRRMQMIYQDPYEALDSRFRVGETVAEPLGIHEPGLPRTERAARVNAALEAVGLSPAARFVHRYPHELSGGQRQRVAIAASIILRPSLLLADEPVSMLDVSVRTGILDLLRALCRTQAMGILMITHDLSTAADYADRIAVMHNGRIVEEGPPAEVVGAPKAAYTRALMAAIPRLDPSLRASA